MRIVDNIYTQPAFEIIKPKCQTQPFVFNSPHSGNSFPQDFIESCRLNLEEMRYSEDAFIDDLFMLAPQMGAPLLRAHFPRAWLDVNREAYELDPSLFKEPLPDHMNVTSPRVLNGFGTVAKYVSNNKNIYKSLLSLEEVMQRINNVYFPYHEALREIIDQTLDKFGIAILVDCHSMPSTEFIARRVSPQGKNIKKRADFILGNQYGRSCHQGLTLAIHEKLAALGYSVEHNNPFAGGYITQKYGTPDRGVHSIQLEINRNLYLNEHNVTPNQNYNRLKGNMSALIQSLIQKSFSDILRSPNASK